MGACPMSPQDIQTIYEQTGVCSILSLQHDDCLAYWEIPFDQLQQHASRVGMALQRCAIRDFDISDMRAQLPVAVAALAHLQRHVVSTYVHCTAGFGRAPLVVLAYLIFIQRFHPECAIHRILASRPQSVPAWEAYHGCRGDLVARLHHQIAQRAYTLYVEDRSRSAHAHWMQAEDEILQRFLLSQGGDS